MSGAYPRPHHQHHWARKSPHGLSGTISASERFDPLPRSSPRRLCSQTIAVPHGIRGPSSRQKVHPRAVASQALLPQRPKHDEDRTNDTSGNRAPFENADSGLGQRARVLSVAEMRIDVLIGRLAA